LRAETNGGQLFRCFKCIVYKRNNKYFEIITIYECVEKYLMTIGCNIWMICLKLNWIFYDPSRILQLSESRAAVVHLNFRAGSTFPVPVCTVSPRHSLGLAGATRLTRSDFRLNLLLLKGHGWVEFVWTLRSSVLVVFNNFFLIDATHRNKISKVIKSDYFSRTLPFMNSYFILRGRYKETCLSVDMCFA